MITLLMSWNCFSQIDTVNTKKISNQLKVDTSVVRLSPRVARLVIKDLIIGDNNKKELNLVKIKLDKVLERETQKDSKILILQNKNQNLNLKVNKKEEQFMISSELSKKLEKELRIEKRNKNAYKIIALIGAVVSTTLVITN